MCKCRYLVTTCVLSFILNRIICIVCLNAGFHVKIFINWNLEVKIRECRFFLTGSIIQSSPSIKCKMVKMVARILSYSNAAFATGFIFYFYCWNQNWQKLSPAKALAIWNLHNFTESKIYRSVHFLFSLQHHFHHELSNLHWSVKKNWTIRCIKCSTS